MPMIQCSECSNRYNSDLFDECPICADREAKLAVAQDPSTGAEALVMLIRDSSPSVSNAAKQNPNTPAWATGTDLDIAKTPEAPADLLGKLVFSDDVHVVEAALANPSTPQWAANRARRNRGEDVPDHQGRIGSHTYSGGGGRGNRVSAGQRRLTKAQLSTTDHLPGQRIIEVLGLVYASKSHTKWKGNSQYERLLTAMEGSEAELVSKANNLGANAIVGIRVSANSAAGNSSMLDVGNSDGIIIVGTAVRTEPLPTPEPQQMCPSCRELIHHKATKCRYCQEKLHDEESESQTDKD